MNRLRTLFSVALFATLAACGGGSGGSGSPTTPPLPTPVPLGPATRTVIDLRDFSIRGGAGVFYNQDQLPEGALDITMQWQNGDNNLQVFITPANACPGTLALLTGGCQILGSSTDPKQKPKLLTYNVPAGKPSVAVWVYNASRQGDSGSVEVGLTSSEKPATPDPNATPVPPGDYKNTLPDGPVTSAFIKVRSIQQKNGSYRDPSQDRDGFWVVYNDEFVVFDLTQKNAGNQECKWANDPAWEVEDKGFVFKLRGSSQPFLLRTDVTKDAGEVNIIAKIDGVTSNTLKVKAKKP